MPNSGAFPPLLISVGLSRERGSARSGDAETERARGTAGRETVGLSLSVNYSESSTYTGRKKLYKAKAIIQAAVVHCGVFLFQSSRSNFFILVTDLLLVRSSSVSNNFFNTFPPLPGNLERRHIDSEKGCSRRYTKSIDCIHHPQSGDHGILTLSKDFHFVIVEDLKL